MKKILFFLSVIAAAVMTSCSKPMSKPEEIVVNPNPLTVVGNKVNAEITGTFPAKKFSKKGVLVVTPVLKYAGKEAVGESVTYVGEKVKENGKRVNYKLGGTYSQTCSFDYVPEMAKSELYLRFSAKVGKKEIIIPDLKVADGVVTTCKLADASENQSIVTPSKFQKVVEQLQEADIQFLLQQSDVRSSETSSQDVKDLMAMLKAAKKDTTKQVSKVEISGYASPEGGLDLNTRLAEQRQANTQRYFSKNIAKDAKVLSSTTAEDWEGFKAAVENSNLADKETILRVLSMYSDPEERENQIRNLASVFNVLKEEILPGLRRSRVIVTTQVASRSDEVLMNLMKNDPSQLNVEEMLYVATLMNNEKDQLDAYQTIASRCGDYRAYNNMGMIYFNQGNVAEARRCYSKALSIEPKNADVNYNAALAAMADGDLKKAETYLGKAAGTKGDLAGAMGTFYTMKGDYKKATASYGASISNNAALQQILNEDYASARTTLKGIAEPNATTAYLKAVLGARTNDREAVYANMKVAVSKDAAYKARAQKDIEFAKFAEDTQFQAIVK